MTVQINSNYLENYSREYAQVVCERFFSSRQFITGQDIIQLTGSTQVNFFVIKRLFELWQEELAKLKSSPYFDYRDIAVHEALTQFMNVLSRRIKVERAQLEPLVRDAVSLAIQVATDPVAFYRQEVGKAPQGKINEYLKENKKYYKWHDKVVSFLVDKTGFGHDADAYLRAISANYQVIKDTLESVNLLLATLGDIKAFDRDLYLPEASVASKIEAEEVLEEAQTSFFEEVDVDEKASVNSSSPEVIEPTVAKPIMEAKPIAEAPPVVKISSSSTGGMLNAAKLKAQFSTESYRGMKGIIGELSESLALNQRFMFSKELFDGNSDLLKHALKSIDECKNFEGAVDLINARFVTELGWEMDSEPVREFLQLVYRKFAD
jgi:hypothetical protein